ncbi:MAG TPA: hypothetical protein VIE42_00425 [Steroidobacteraceae bacterium]
MGKQVMERAYRNVGCFLLVLVPIFVAGFWIPYLSEIPKFESSITPAVHVHAVLLFSWIGLLVVQPFAIRYQAFALHRLLGKASFILMSMIVPFALAMIWKEYHEKISAGTTMATARNAELISAAQLAVIVGVYVLAIIRILRRDVAAHMRYMICIALFLLPPGLARTLGYWFGVGQTTAQTVCLAAIDLCLAALILFDRRRQLNAQPYVTAFMAYNITAVVWLAVGRPV